MLERLIEGLIRHMKENNNSICHVYVVVIKLVLEPHIFQSPSSNIVKNYATFLSCISLLIVFAFRSL